MKHTKSMLVLLFLIPGTVMAQRPVAEAPQAWSQAHLERSDGISRQRSLDDHSGVSAGR